MTKFDFIGMVLAAPEASRGDMLRQMADMSGTDYEVLLDELNKRAETDKVKLEREARKREREAKARKLAEVTAAVEAVRGDWNNLEVFSEDVTELGGHILLSGFDNGTPTFTVGGVSLPKGGGNKGGGKPAANQPRPWLGYGERVKGQLNKWAEDNVGLDLLKDLASEHDMELVFSEKTGALSSKGLVKLLKAAGVLVDSEVTPDELAAFEASRD